MLIHVSKQNLLLPWYFFLKISSEIYLHGSEFLSSTLWAPNTFLCGAQPRYLLGEALCAFRPYQYSLLPSCVYVCARARTLFFQPTPALQRACEMTAVAWQTAVKRQWTGVGEEGCGGGGVTFNTSLWFPGRDGAACRYGEVFSHFGVPPWDLTDHLGVPVKDSVPALRSSYLFVIHTG